MQTNFGDETTVTISPSLSRNHAPFVSLIVFSVVAGLSAATLVISPVWADFGIRLYGLWPAAIFGTLAAMNALPRFRHANRIDITGSHVDLIAGGCRRSMSVMDVASLDARLAYPELRDITGRPLATLYGADWHGTPMRLLADALMVRNYGVWPPAVLVQPSTSAQFSMPKPID